MMKRIKGPDGFARQKFEVQQQRDDLIPGYHWEVTCEMNGFEVTCCFNGRKRGWLMLGSFQLIFKSPKVYSPDLELPFPYWRGYSLWWASEVREKEMKLEQKELYIKKVTDGL